MTMSLSRFLLSVVIAAAPISLSAQVPISKLAPTNGQLNSSFAKQPLDESLAFRRIIQEFSNGKVLIAQAEGDQMILADFATGTMEVLKDMPSGQLIALPADSSIVKGFSRWTYFDGLRSVGILGEDRIRRLFTSRIEAIRGADDSGRLLVETASNGRDSAVVSWVNRATGSRDTIAKLWRDPPPPPGNFRPVCKQSEGVTLAPDGWIAVVRARPYRVDWRRPNGNWALGPSLHVPAQLMSDGDRSTYLQWRDRDRPALPRDTVKNWPMHPCEWTSGFTAKASPDGYLLVYRVPTSTVKAITYDVVNREGKLVRQLQLPENEAIIAFGRSSVYVVRTVNNSQLILRHPWP
ncbi:MAG: hypothetical protein ACO1Q7_07345 [Gemmatimonas sp.]